MHGNRVFELGDRNVYAILIRGSEAFLFVPEASSLGGRIVGVALGINWPPLSLSLLSRPCYYRGASGGFLLVGIATLENQGEVKF